MAIKLVDANTSNIDIDKINIERTIEEIIYHNHASAFTKIDFEKLRKETNPRTLLKTAKMVRSNVAIRV